MNFPQKVRQIQFHSGIRLPILALIVCAFGLPSCTNLPIGNVKSSSESPSQTSRKAAKEHIPPDEPVAALAYWGAKYDEAPRDEKVALMYGRYLRYLRREKRAVEVLGTALASAPKNAELMAEYGKALVAANRLDEGEVYMARAEEAGFEDWTLYSAQGVLFDRQGRHQEAALKYEAALKRSPNEPEILNNYALSKAQAGDLVAAESLLRRAVIHPSATSRIRLNLSIVLSLKGDLEGAMHYASIDLPQHQVEENIAILNGTAQAKTPWEALQSLDRN